MQQTVIGLLRLSNSHLTTRLSALCLLICLLNGCATNNNEIDMALLKTPQAVIEAERAMEDALMRRDVSYLSLRIADNFEYVHGDGWRDGGEALLREARQSWLAGIAEHGYLYRKFDSVKAEVFGNTAKTHGHFEAKVSLADGREVIFEVWYVRLYEFRDGQWVWLKHFTVLGPKAIIEGDDES